MEPLLILIPGLLGGLALALLIAATRRRPVFPVVSRRLEEADPSLINMAHIRVEGIGGLGLVAAVVAVAVTDPRIRLAIAIAAILGSGLALLLIALHRRLDARRSGGPGSDDRSTLHLEDRRLPRHPATHGNDRDDTRTRALELLPVRGAA